MAGPGNNLPEIRPTYQIVLSCFFTILLVLSAAIRPDCPSPYASKYHGVSTKLNIAFWMIIAPETMLFWSYRQWYEARRIGHEYKGRGWTTTQGMFLIMGGFMLYKDGKPEQILSINYFREHVAAGTIIFPSITTQEIRSRSKLHPLLLAIAFIQATWFITQCVARLVNGLYPTQLEVATVAVTVLSGLTTFFWWEKPLDSSLQIRIDLQHALTFPELIEGTGARHWLFESRLEQYFESFVARMEPDEASATRSPYIIRLFKFLIYHLVARPSFILMRDAARINMNPRGPVKKALAVPMFYAPQSIESWRHYGHIPCLLLGAGFAAANVVFITSPSLFPSHRLYNIWRVVSYLCAAYMTTAVTACITATVQFHLERRRERSIIIPILLVIGIVLYIVQMAALVAVFFAYVAAKCSLWIMAFVCLRDLPEKALKEVQWTGYMPHFG